MHSVLALLLVSLLMPSSIASLSSTSPSNSSSIRLLEKKSKLSKPPNAVPGVWHYQKKNSLEYTGCTLDHEANEWIMLNAYRGGGTEGTHWKFTKDENDKDCLVDWTYYAKDGKWVMEQVKGRLTKDSKKRTWCALPVYRKGGLQGNQWDFCDWNARL